MKIKETDNLPRVRYGTLSPGDVFQCGTVTAIVQDEDDEDGDYCATDLSDGETLRYSGDDLVLPLPNATVYPNG